jgi:hypothetical protein
MSTRVKFQRRHYKALAEIVRRARARAQHNDTIAEAVADIEQDLVDLFRADNSKFSASRFIAAANEREQVAA